MKIELVVLISIFFIGTKIGFSQDYEVVFDTPSPKISLVLQEALGESDTIIFLSSKETSFNYSYTRNSNSRNIEVTFSSLKKEHVGRYKLIVASKGNMSALKETYAFRIKTPIPLVRSIKRDNETILASNPPQIIWKNTVEDNIVLRIEGENFYFNNSASAIVFPKESGILVNSITIDSETIINVDLNLKGARPGLIVFKLINFDGETSNHEFLIIPNTLPKFSETNVPVNLNNGRNEVFLKCDFPYHVSEIYLQNIKTKARYNDISFEIFNRKLSPESNILPLMIDVSVAGFIPGDYKVVVKTYGNSETSMLPNPFRVNSAEPTFLPLEGYPFELLSSKKLQISKPINMFSPGESFWMKSDKDSIEFVYTEETSVPVKCFIEVKNGELKFDNITPGEYSITRNSTTLKGSIRTFEWPKIVSVVWEPKESQNNRYFNGDLYATNKPQKYRVKITLSKMMDLETAKWRIFGMPPSYVGIENNNTIVYDLVIPDTIKSGTFPVFQYQTRINVFENVNVAGLVKPIKEYSRPAVEDGFINIATSENGEKIEFMTLSSGLPENFGLDKQFSRIYYSINNLDEYNAGTQTIVLSFECNSQKEYTDTLEFQQGESDNLYKDLKFHIHPWDTLTIKVEFIGKTYQPYVQSQTIIRKIFFYKKTKVVFGLGIPVTATVVKDIKADDWIFSPLTGQVNFTWHIYKSTKKDFCALAPGMSLGVSNLQKLVDDDQNYFGLIVNPYIETDLIDLFRADNPGKVKFPFHFGLGAVSEWKSGTLYVNPVVLFSFGLNITGGS